MGRVLSKVLERGLKGKRAHETPSLAEAQAIWTQLRGEQTREQERKIAEREQQQQDIRDLHFMALFEMFPNLEKDLVRALYAERGGDMEKTIETLLPLAHAEGGETAAEDEWMMDFGEEGRPSSSRSSSPISNEVEWPILANAGEDWEVCGAASLSDLEEPKTPRDWAQMARKAAPLKP